MNERIKQLAEQNGFIHEWQSPGEQRDILKNLERFAELVVKECVKYFNEDYQRDFDTLWREDLTKGIKEHFGVEQ